MTIRVPILQCYCGFQDVVSSQYFVRINLLRLVGLIFTWLIWKFSFFCRSGPSRAATVLSLVTRWVIADGWRCCYGNGGDGPFTVPYPRANALLSNKVQVFTRAMVPIYGIGMHALISACGDTISIWKSGGYLPFHWQDMAMMLGDWNVPECVWSLIILVPLIWKYVRKRFIILTEGMLRWPPHKGRVQLARNFQERACNAVHPITAKAGRKADPRRTTASRKVQWKYALWSSKSYLDAAKAVVGKAADHKCYKSLYSGYSYFGFVIACSNFN